ncbi:MAG: hypothetical protein IPI49_23520 [Myxococcales bacterium]|nr:hypothetical protein [Myxococcales bacterium]
MSSLLLLCPAVVRADASVTVTLTPEGRLIAASQGSSPEQLAAEIKAEVDDAFQTNDVPGFLRSFTDATAFSQRGLAVDYVSVPSSFIIGLGGNAAISSKNLLEEDRPTAGVAPNLGFMLGANLAEMGLPRWTVYANGFYHSASTDRLSGHLTSAGAHLQVKLIQPAGDSGAARAFRWTGLDVTSGVEYTRWSLEARDALTNSFPTGAGATAVDMTMDSTGRFELGSNAVTVPVEASTGLRFLGILSVYAGAGIDFTAGKSTVDAALTGAIRTTTGGVDVGSAQVNASGENTGSPAAMRALLGLQLNLWKLKIFTQGNVSQTPAASVSFGLRLVL